MRKGQKDFYDKRAKQEDPVGTKEGTKQMIPKQLQYGKPEDEAEFLSIRKVQRHDEPNDEERMQLEKVRCFMYNVKWCTIEEDDDETVGITWLELLTEGAKR